MDSMSVAGRRAFLKSAFGAAAMVACGSKSFAQSATPFAQWVETFRARARARGISDATYSAVMANLKPDTSVFAQNKNQPEFREPVWMYINRRVSSWRIETGKSRLKTHAALLDRIERDYGVDRHVMLGLWGMESAFGEVMNDSRIMRPVIPSLAALAWGEPRRRAYWEQELLNALVIIERGWSKRDEMVGSWAGAMGHTQWMPEVWLNIGVDYDKDGRISPFGPEDAFGGTARYLVQRGRYRRGEGWGCEVRVPSGVNAPQDVNSRMRLVSEWRDLGVTAVVDRMLPPAARQARLWRPVAAGPAFLLTQNFSAARSYNPSSNYALALVHLGDRIRGEEAFAQPFPGGERILTLAEIQEMQKRLIALGYDTEHTDGRSGIAMLNAVREYQRKVGMKPVDGYPGLRLLAHLRGR